MWHHKPRVLTMFYTHTEQGSQRICSRNRSHWQPCWLWSAITINEDWLANTVHTQLHAPICTNGRWQHAYKPQQPLQETFEHQVYVFSPSNTYCMTTLSNTRPQLHGRIDEFWWDMGLLRWHGLIRSSSKVRRGQKRCERRRKWGKRTGIHTRLRAKPTRPTGSSLPG